MREGYYKPPPGARLDWSRPLAHSMVRAWLLNEGHGTPYESVRGQQGLRTNGSPAWVRGVDGPAVNFSSTAIGYPDDGDISGPKVTWVISLRPDNLTQTAAVWQKREGVATKNNWTLRWGGTSTFDASTGTGGGTDKTYKFPCSGWSLTQYQQIVIVHDSTRGAGFRIRMWRDGVEILSPTVETEGSGAIPALSDGTNIEFGRINTGTYYTGGLAYAYAFTTAWDEDQIKECAARPFSMWAEGYAPRHFFMRRAA